RIRTVSIRRFCPRAWSQRRRGGSSRHECAYRLEGRTSSLSIVPAAHPSPYPHHRPRASAGSFPGAVLGFFDRGYRNPIRLERVHGIPVLGQIPLSQFRGVGDRHPSVTVIKQPSSRFADAVQTVCTSLTCAQVAHEEKVILVTSAVQGEGKTALAVALGRFAA